MAKKARFNREDESLVFTCTSCGLRCNKRTAVKSCSCGSNLFKVSGMSTTFTPEIDDPENTQSDPYRKKKSFPGSVNNSENGIQWTVPFGEGTGTGNAVGDYTEVHSPEHVDKDGIFEPLNTENPADKNRTFPSDGGEGDNGSHGNAPYDESDSEQNGIGLLPDDSPLKKRNQDRKSPFNNMQHAINDDPVSDDPIRDISRRRWKL